MSMFNNIHSLHVIYIIISYCSVFKPWPLGSFPGVSGRLGEAEPQGRRETANLVRPHALHVPAGLAELCLLN